VLYDQGAMRVQLGDTLLMDEGQPLDFDAVAASKYLKETTAVHGTVRRQNLE
jgi:glutamate N-acetyltransferase/amino-acid N-acetyltransferase